MANNQIALMAKAPVFDTPFESQGKALQLRNAMNQSQAADMEMQQKRQAAQEMEVQRNALMSDPTGGDGYINALATGGAPTAYFSAKKAGLDAQKTTADINKTKAESDKSRFDIANKRFDAIGQSIGSLTQIPGGATPQHVTSAVQRLVDIGVIDPEMASSITASVPQDPAQMQEWLAQGQAAIMDGKSQLSFTTPDANAVLSAKTSRANNAATVGASYANAAATRSIAAATRDAAAIQRDQATEMKLGDDYRAQSKDFKSVADAYKQINSTLDKATTSPAATLAAATKFMKLLDPGSVVRESELGMALAATGVFDRATNYFNTLQRGKVLTPNQVADFKSITQQIYGAAQAGQKDVDSNYRRQAEAYKLRPEMIIQDLGQNADPKGKPSAPALPSGWSVKEN